VTKYWTPSEYYSGKYKNNITVLYPWQRINQKLEQAKITALIELAYTDHNDELIEFNSAKEFYIQYQYDCLGINIYFFIVY
jgi:hypothetical protein